MKLEQARGSYVRYPFSLAVIILLARNMFAGKNPDFNGLHFLKNNAGGVEADGMSLRDQD